MKYPETVPVLKSGDVMSGNLTFTGNANVNVDGTGKIMEKGVALIPRGIIVMWSGSSLSVPTEWQICDGTNGTPNLRGKFIVSAGGQANYADGAEGGQNTLSIATADAGAHTHSMTTDTQGAHTHTGVTGGHVLTVNELPAHSHNLGTTGVPRIGTGHGYVGTAGVTGVALPSTDSTGNNIAHNHTISSDGNHSHMITSNASGTHSHIVAFDNRPQYYALAYIMKL